MNLREVKEICPLVYEVELSKGHVYWCFDQVYDNSVSVKITQFIWLSVVIYISIVHACTCMYMYTHVWAEWAARVGVIFIVSKIHTHCVDMLISLWNVPFSKCEQSTPYYIHIYIAAKKSSYYQFINLKWESMMPYTIIIDTRLAQVGLNVDAA